jgi:hypothetical protein
MTACTIIQTEPYLVYEIDLEQLSAPIEISAIVKSFGTLKYVYTFTYFNEIIKHGISVDENSIPGERIYRQAGHLEGWPKQLAVGSAGDDMRDINDRYFANTNAWLNRKGMKIIIRDLTGIASPSVSDENLHVRQLERQLIKEYNDLHNKLPIGNIKDESYIDNKTYVTKVTIEKLFDFN